MERSAREAAQAVARGRRVASWQAGEVILLDLLAYLEGEDERVVGLLATLKPAGQADELAVAQGAYRVHEGLRAWLKRQQAALQKGEVHGR